MVMVTEGSQKNITKILLLHRIKISQSRLYLFKQIPVSLKMQQVVYLFQKVV